MARPPLEVADLIRAAGDAFIERNRHWLRWKHVKVLRAIARCRTAALGGQWRSRQLLYEMGARCPQRVHSSRCGNAYDFSKDLSTIIYGRPGGHADPGREVAILLVCAAKSR
jgi:hypothetical protein